MSEGWRGKLAAALQARFGADVAIPAEIEDGTALARMADHRVIRRYLDKPVSGELLRLLCATALSAPTKSDLQQADIVIVTDPALRRRLIEPVAEQNPWALVAPALLVFCGDNRRQRLVHQWRGKPFVNDHLDAFFNAAVDSALTLATFVAAAESIGLGACPISALRNHAELTSDLLGLPQHVFPVAGLAVGWPSFAGVRSPRLPIEVTVHENRHSEAGLRERIDAYDRRRDAVQPYKTQRASERFGEAAFYGWSEDKARQYAVPEREGFGAFVRAKGFKLD
jgi:nitroreductase